jgi:hypothetical protein
MAVHILFDEDHRERAERLAGQTPGATSGPIATIPYQLRRGGELDILTFWGHGDPNNLCGKTLTELTALIKNWKKLNTGMNTIEIITCDARHSMIGGDSFATKLKRALSAGILSTTRKTTLKALPVAAAANTCSILCANAVSLTWVYITALDYMNLNIATDLILYDTEKVGVSRPENTNYTMVANQMVSRYPTRNWQMTYGTFQNLRKILNRV